MTSEARFILNVGVAVLLLGVLLTSLVLAWLKGRPAERYGASIYALSVGGTTAIELITGQSLPWTNLFRTTSSFRITS